MNVITISRRESFYHGIGEFTIQKLNTYSKEYPLFLSLHDKMTPLFFHIANWHLTDRCFNGQSCIRCLLFIIFILIYSHIIYHKINRKSSFRIVFNIARPTKNRFSSHAVNLNRKNHKFLILRNTAK